MIGGLTYLSDSDDHVANKRFDSGDCTSLFVSTIPHSESHEETLLGLGLNLHYFDLDCNVAEVLGDFTLWALDSDFSCLAGHLYV